MILQALDLERNCYFFGGLGFLSRDIKADLPPLPPNRCDSLVYGQQ
jgi:hypothetical protein